MATSPDPSIRRSLLRLVAVSVALTAASFAGCTVDQDSFENPGAGAGGENSQSANSPGDTPLPKTDLDCTVPEPGCLCDTEGQHLTCGKVVSKNSHGQASCGQGVSVCTNGVWGECVLTGLDPIPLEEAPPGFYHTQKAQTPTPCQNNPCNPYCWNYPDGPNDAGIADSGTNLDPQDGGLGTTWDAGPLPCTPLTQSQACAGGKNCGEVANGCGGVVSCGNDICAKANQGEICGGNGVPNQCGKPPIPNCTPQTTAQACSGGKNCGWVPNGCGGVISCGNCGANQTCGLGGLNICGPNCTPKTCTQLGKNCGLWGDGCGNTVSCGTCPTGQICGAYSPNVCWAPGNCTKKTVQQACQNAGKDCGAVPDGCGGTLECGACPANKLCGGGGTPNVCGGNVCVPKTYQQACSNVGKNCGPISDGCGGTIDCGTCQAPASCGGGGVPNKCGTPANCTNLCLQQTVCPVQGQTTSISGTVYAPNGIHPLPNVVVYVPNGTVSAFPNQITCENCAVATGDPLVSTKTATDGTFTITNMPVGNNIPLVIQVGRWRRQIKIPKVTACQNTVVDASLTRLPRNKSEGDIPKIAVNTGVVDAMECVLRRMGIDDSEFTVPSGSGRINFFLGGYYEGSYIGNYGDNPTEPDLVQSVGALSKYDMVLFPCQANYYAWNNGYEKVFQDNIAAYLNTGGRAFFTHYNFHWLLKASPYWNSPLYSAINWNVNQWANDGTVTSTINQGFVRGQQLAQWLKLPSIGASSTLGQIPIGFLRRDYSGWDSNNTINWLDYGGNSYHVTFDTPLNVTPDNKCGRAVYSDFHVYNSNSYLTKFPGECPGGAMSPQEKLLEYMIFDLSSCVGSQPPPPPCQKLTCQQQGITCGNAGDGCGGVLNCGSACPVPTCTPRTCQQQGFDCGQVGDGCGGTIDCGTCAINQVCGGVNNATPNKCDEVKCVKNACATGSGVYCGPFPHGCEPEPPNFLLTLDRSGSMTGKVGTKTKWQIAVDAVNKLTTNYQNKMRFGLSLFPDHDTSTPCNQTKTISVPVAPGKETTIQNLLNASLVSSNVNYPKGKMTNLYNAVVQDNGHQPPLNDPTRKNFVVLLTDGAQNCGDKTTADNNTVTLLQNMYNQGIGTFVIGFGSGIDATALNKFANAGGYPKPGGGNKFYDAQDEASLNTALEMIAEQATSLQCDCTEPGETCGGGGIPHKCGKPCVPNTCPSGSGSFCGDMPDGCGGTLKCGCTLPETCGGSGIIDKCGQATCKPISCADQGIACGQAGDGCGNEINCGTCPAPQTCGGGGVPGQCGAVKFYTDGYFVRDYIASCPSGTAPYWQLWSWTALTPDDSSLDFQIQTADDEAGLASATSVPLRFSVPPGPSGLQNQVVTVKSNPSPDTQVGAASVDNTLQLAGLMRNKKYLRVTTHLKPTADKLKTAMLKMWNMQVDCIPSE